jgi:2-phospho-L-lactate guanylyltransferase
MLTAVQAAVLLPVKTFSAAKVRLSAVLEPGERADLARHMATVVVTAAAPLPTYVVCDGDDVATWAASMGAQVLWRPGLGLNGAVRSGVDALAVAGYDRVIVAHGDLPLATSLAWVARFPGITLVPDRRDDGTNVIALDPALDFEFGYGLGSFQHHIREARQLRQPVRVVRDPTLGWDVDLPDDLSRVGPWISPASRP